ncbi:hypothetical protein BC827DRAFT_1260528 [Russula dissimulans]|nr:hypothetical protein BC827DRAFT_1260528 [Russula dissimulans]
MRYTVFLGAPSPSSTLSDDDLLYRWHSLEATSNLNPVSTTIDLLSGYPSSALDAASRRLSAMYENIIFAEDDEDEGDTQAVEEDLIGDRRGDHTTLVTWAATTQPDDSVNGLASRVSISRRPSSWRSNLETQEDHLSSNAYSDTDTSSIARFPDFQFSLGTLSTLASARGKTCLLLAVLEVDGPDEVTIRRGPETGQVVSVLRLIVGDEASTIRKLTAWRQVAETWGGGSAPRDAVGIRRGDVVHFETTPAEGGAGAPTPTITASPHHHSRAKICYRTMPREAVPADMYLRPDLRLGASDAAVRRVAAVVGWFERMAGLDKEWSRAS